MKISLGLTPDDQDCFVSSDDIKSLSIESGKDTVKTTLNRRILNRFKDSGYRVLIVDPENEYDNINDNPDDYTVNDTIGMINHAGSLAYSGNNVVLFIDHYSLVTRNMSTASLSAVEDALIYLHRHSDDSGIRLIISNTGGDMSLPYHPSERIYVGAFDMLDAHPMLPKKFYARVYAAIRDSRFLSDHERRHRAILFTDRIQHFTIGD